MIDPGYDLSGFEDLTPDMREATPERALLESHARWLITPRGSIPGEPTRGIDIREILHDSVNQSQLVGLIAAELRLEEGIDSVDVNLLEQDESLTIETQITPEDSLEPYTFNLELTEKGVELK